MTGEETILPDTTLEEDQCHDFEDFLKNQPPSTTWEIDGLKYNNLPGIVQAARDNNLIAVSDGSHKGNIGTAAVRIEDKTNSNKYISISFQVPSRSETMQSTRAELGGVLGMVILLSCFKEFFVIEEIMIATKCDNTTATKVTELQQLPPPNTSDWDITSSIIRATKEWKISINCTWIKGHSSIPFNEMTRWQQLNFLTNKAAKSKCQHIFQEAISQTTSLTTFPFEIRITINGQPQSRVHNKITYRKITKSSTRETWTKIRNLNESQIELTNWKALSESMKK